MMLGLKIESRFAVLFREMDFHLSVSAQSRAIGIDVYFQRVEFIVFWPRRLLVPAKEMDKRYG